MAEWFKAPVLKTGRGFRSLVGSNPTPSARTSPVLTRTPSKNICRLRINGVNPCAASFFDRPQPGVGDLYAGERDRAAIRRHEFASRRSEPIANEAFDCFGRDSVGEHESLTEAVGGIGEYSERAASFRAKSGLSGRHHAIVLRCAGGRSQACVNVKQTGKLVLRHLATGRDRLDIFHLNIGP